MPVSYVDLTPEEEDLILATFDRITAHGETGRGEAGRVLTAEGGNGFHLARGHAGELKRWQCGSGLSRNQRPALPMTTPHPSRPRHR